FLLCEPPTRPLSALSLHDALPICFHFHFRLPRRGMYPAGIPSSGTVSVAEIQPAAADDGDRVLPRPHRRPHFPVLFAAFHIPEHPFAHLFRQPSLRFPADPIHPRLTGDGGKNPHPDRNHRRLPSFFRCPFRPGQNPGASPAPSWRPPPPSDPSDRRRVPPPPGRLPPPSLRSGRWHEAIPSAPGT